MYDGVCVWGKSSHVLQSHLFQGCLASDSANGLFAAAVVEPAGNVGIGREGEGADGWGRRGGGRCTTLKVC